MPIYHLNVRGGGTTAKDDIGIELPNPAAARDAALALLANSGRASAASQFPVEEVVVTDNDDHELMTLKARDL
jgi:hypothetical protein